MDIKMSKTKMTSKKQYLKMNDINRNIFKGGNLNRYEMFPSDPLGSLDVFFFIRLNCFGGVFYG